MLSTRSARLAALLLLALFAGWKVRSCRKGGASSSPPAPAPAVKPAAPWEQTPRNAFPDE